MNGTTDISRKIRFNPEITLGTVFQILTMIASMLGVVYYIGARQETLFQQNVSILERLGRDEAEMKDARRDFVTKEVNTVAQQVLIDRLDYISADVQAIKGKMGLPSAPVTKMWR